MWNHAYFNPAYFNSLFWHPAEGAPPVAPDTTEWVVRIRRRSRRGRR